MAESVFKKYANPALKAENKKSAFFDRKMIKRVSGAFAGLAMLGVGLGITNNRLEQQQVKRDLATVITDADYSNVSHMDYAQKQLTINKINEITGEFTSKMTPLHELDRMSTDFTLRHQGEEKTIANAPPWNVDGNVNAASMKRSYVLIQEMNGIYNKIKDNPQYSDIKDKVMIKTIRMTADYNEIVNSKNFEDMFASSSFYLKNTEIEDSFNLTFNQWAEKLDANNISAVGNNVETYLQGKIGEPVVQKAAETPKVTDNIYNNSQKDPVEKINNTMAEIGKNVNTISNGITSFGKSFDENIKRINSSIEEIQREGRAFNSKVQDYHHQFEHSYGTLQKSYHDAAQTYQSIKANPSENKESVHVSAPSTPETAQHVVNTVENHVSDNSSSKPVDVKYAKIDNNSNVAEGDLVHGVRTNDVSFTENNHEDDDNVPQNNNTQSQDEHFYYYDMGF